MEFDYFAHFLKKVATKITRAFWGGRGGGGRRVELCLIAHVHLQTEYYK